MSQQQEEQVNLPPGYENYEELPFGIKAVRNNDPMFIGKNVYQVQNSDEDMSSYGYNTKQQIVIDPTLQDGFVLQRPQRQFTPAPGMVTDRRQVLQTIQQTGSLGQRIMPNNPRGVYSEPVPQMGQPADMGQYQQPQQNASMQGQQPMQRQPAPGNNYQGRNVYDQVQAQQPQQRRPEVPQIAPPNVVAAFVPDTHLPADLALDPIEAAYHSIDLIENNQIVLKYDHRADNLGCRVWWPKATNRQLGIFLPGYPSLFHVDVLTRFFPVPHLEICVLKVVGQSNQQPAQEAQQGGYADPSDWEKYPPGPSGPPSGFNEMSGTASPQGLAGMLGAGVGVPPPPMPSYVQPMDRVGRDPNQEMSEIQREQSILNYLQQQAQGAGHDQSGNRQGGAYSPGRASNQGGGMPPGFPGAQ